LGTNTQTVDIDIKSYKEGQDDGQVKIYFTDGTTITYEIDDLLPGEANNEELTMSISESKEFDKIEVISNNNKEFKIEGVTVASGESYNYTINLTSSSSDSSETLSDITLSSLPDGVTIKDANGDVLAANDDGSYSIEANSAITVVSTTELSADILNSMTASISSSDGSDSNVTTVTAKLEIDGTSGDDTLTATDADEVIDGGAGADTINAGAGDDNIVFDSADTIDGGEGLDTLVVEGETAIDFSALADDSINNIEVIDLGAGEQNISISVDDVLDMTDTENLLRIDGDSTDSINLSDQGNDVEWTLGNFKTDAETGATYQEVTGVEDDVTVTLEISTDIIIDQN
ncbi:MAG: hypothetical protein J7K14_02805, partial [Sulfurimonas sp.]|nr:hypothetical protein [Sulfurimonas sp.]